MCLPSPPPPHTDGAPFLLYPHSLPVTTPQLLLYLPRSKGSHQTVKAFRSATRRSQLQTVTVCLPLPYATAHSYLIYIYKHMSGVSSPAHNISISRLILVSSNYSILSFNY